jgi:hypothetical protein
MKKKKLKEPKLLDILLLTKLSDGTVRQIIVDKQEAKYILDLLTQTSKSGKVTVHEPIVSGIDFEARWDLSAEYGC